MYRQRLFVFVLLLLAVPTDAEAQAGTCSCPPDVICVFHHDASVGGPVYCDQDGKLQPLHDGSAVKVAPGKPKLQVCDTNTALYDFKATRERIDSPEAKELSTFLSNLGPYLLEAAAGLPALTLEQKVQSLETVIPPDPRAVVKKHLELLDLTLAQLKQIEIALLARYDDMSRGVEPSTAIQVFQADGVVTPHFSGLDTANPTLDLLARLRGIYAELAANVLLVTPADDPLRTAAQKALGESDKVFQYAYNLESLARNLVQAESCWTFGPTLHITPQNGQQVTLKITRKKIAEVARLARMPEAEVTFKVLPVWNVKPTVGLSLLYSEESTFATFGTEELEDEDGFKIIEKEIEDERASWGLTLGLTPAALDRRTEGGLTPWLDITINPSDDVKAFGVGLALQKGFWRFGAGWLWTKHEELRGGFAPGDVIDGETAPIRETYGDGELYFAFSVTGWPPFVPE